MICDQLGHSTAKGHLVYRKKEKFLYDFLTWVHDPNKENKQALIDNHYGGDEFYDRVKIDRQRRVHKTMQL